MAQNTTTKTRTFVNAIDIKTHTFQDGNMVLNCGINLERFIAELKPHVNAKGWVNVTIGKRKTPSQYGQTHSMYLDQRKPADDRRPAELRPGETAVKLSLEDDSADDMPF